MNLEGSADLKATRQAVWDTLLDLQAFSDCLPGVQDVRQLDADRFQGVVRATVGPMTGSFDLQATITGRQPPERMTVRVEGTDSVTKSRLTSDVVLTLTELATGTTQLAHQASVDVKGRLALLGDLVLRATAAAMFDEFAKRLRAKVETAPVQGTPS